MSVRKSMAWAFSGQFISFFVTFLGSVVVARLLSPHELGIYAIAMATLGVLQVVTAFGVGAYVIRDTELEPRTIETAFTVNAILSLALASIMFAVSFAGRLVFGDPGAGDVMRLLALNPLIGIFVFRPSTLMQREMRFKAIASIGLCTAVIAAGVTSVCAWRGLSYMSPAYGSLASALFGLVAFNVLGARHAGLGLSLTGWRPMTAFGLRMMSISGVAVLVGRLSEIVLGRTVSLSALGLYSRAASIATLMFQNLYGTATQVLFTKLAKDFRERGELRRPFLQAFQIITGFMWPAQLGLAVLAGPAISIIYGDKWLAAALPLSLFMIGQALTLSYGMNWELFVLRDETARQTRIEVGRSLVGFVLFVIGCRFGISGAAASTIVSSLIGAVLYYPHMNRLADIAPGDLFRIYRHSALLTFVAVAPAFVLMMVSGWSPHTSPVLLAAAVILGVAFWLAAIAWLRHPLMNELRLLAQRLTPSAA